MTITDSELVAEYAAKRSESAFRALVARHVGLVYATALRQLGDPGLAEETTQNVFIALARKSSRLAGMETVAGWLHRCAILESKALMRAELRRRRREQLAIEAVACSSEGESPLSLLVPLVDEALLNLRDTDRLALVLRFFEGRSLREVGQVLGVEEDAARKRVDRALDKVTDFFHQRGFAAAGATGAVVLANAAAEAAPAGLAVSAASAGLAGGGASGLGVVILHIMTLTKVQTALICAAALAVPLTVQCQARAHISQEQQTASAQLSSARQEAGQLDAQLKSARDALAQSQAQMLAVQARLQLATNRLNAKNPIGYQWNDASPVARVPKAVLKSLDFSAIKDGHGQLNDTIKEVLELSDGESRQLQDAIDRFYKKCNDTLAANLRPVDSANVSMPGRPTNSIRAFAVPAIGPGEYAQMLDQFMARAQAVLEPERLERFKNSIFYTIPSVNTFSNGFSSTGSPLSSIAHFEAISKPQPGEPYLVWFSETLLPDGQSQTTTHLYPDDVPDFLCSQLQDWIEIARKNAEGGTR